MERWRSTKHTQICLVLQPPLPLRLNRTALVLLIRTQRCAPQDGEVDGSEGDETKARKLPAGAKVGIVTYDKEVQFYNLTVNEPRSTKTMRIQLTWSQANLNQAQMMVMTDLEEPFVPLSEGLFVDPYESKYVLVKSSAFLLVKKN